MKQIYIKICLKKDNKRPKKFQKTIVKQKTQHKNLLYFFLYMV